MVDSHCLFPDLSALIEAAIAESVRALASRLSARDREGPADLGRVDVADVRQARQGGPDAYRRLVERHQAYVAGILWRFSRDRRVHEELVQDVFVEAYLSLGGYRGNAPFEHWLARIATRVGYRHWKEMARRKKTQPFRIERWDKASDDDGIVATLEPDDAAALLHDLLAQLPPRDRLVLTLRYLDQCDVEQTARRIGWTKTMVKVQTMRARKRLQKLIERSGTEWIQ